MTRESAKAIVKDLQEHRSALTAEYNRLYGEVGLLNEQIKELYTKYKLHQSDEAYYANN